MDPSQSSPLYALANAHFLLAGPVLGLVGAGLAWMRGARGWRPLAWLVAGKTLSTWVLVFPLSVACAGLLPRLLGMDPLGRLPWLYLGFGLLLLLASGILEWPFFHRALPRNGRTALALSFRANAVCLVVLAALYLPCCSLGLLEVPRWNGIAAASDAGTQVFYLREGALLARGLSGPEKCLDPEVPHGAEARLFARRGEIGWDLWLQERDHAPRMVQRGVAPSQAEAPAQPALHIKLQKTTRTVEPALPETHGKPAEGFLAEDSDWILHLSEWPWQGLEVESKDLRGGYRLALDTPLLSWEARCATRLPGERLLFQMGPYLWLLELETRRLRLFAKGQGAQVVRMVGK
jgi:hypothetical protein